MPMHRSTLRIALVAALGLAGVAGCGGNGGPGDKEVVVDIGEFGELAGPPITTPTTGDGTGAPTTTVVPPTNQSLADALNAGDCAAIEPSNDALRVLTEACEAGELGTPEAWAEALAALRGGGPLGAGRGDEASCWKRCDPSWSNGQPTAAARSSGGSRHRSPVTAAAPRRPGRPRRSRSHRPARPPSRSSPRPPAIHRAPPPSPRRRRRHERAATARRRRTRDDRRRRRPTRRAPRPRTPSRTRLGPTPRAPPSPRRQPAEPSSSEDSEAERRAACSTSSRP